VTWVAIIMVTRYSSLAALVALVFAPASAYIFNRQDMMWICLVILCFVTGKHENNIKRLLKGTEPRVGQ
jgi:acyl phosphate:glycerol-3-phosphate acyltransferase